VQIIPLRRKDRKYSKSLSWLNQELFTYFKHEKEDCTKWKLGQLAKAKCNHINQRSYSRKREGYLRDDSGRAQVSCPLCQISIERSAAIRRSNTSTNRKA